MLETLSWIKTTQTLRPLQQTRAGGVLISERANFNDLADFLPPLHPRTHKKKTKNENRLL